jgi:hypothetical protein
MTCDLPAIEAWLETCNLFVALRWQIKLYKYSFWMTEDKRFIERNESGLGGNGFLQRRENCGDQGWDGKRAVKRFAETTLWTSQRRSRRLDSFFCIWNNLYELNDSFFNRPSFGFWPERLPISWGQERANERSTYSAHEDSRYGKYHHAQYYTSEEYFRYFIATVYDR